MPRDCLAAINMKTSSEICFVCGSKGASSILYTRPHDEGFPYFSFLESHIPPRGAHRPTGSGAVNACAVCHAFLNQQWDAFERSRTPLVKRLYWLKRVDNGTFTGAEMSIQGEYMAQLMGLHGIGTEPCGASLFSGGNQTGIACGDAPSPASPDDAESVVLDVASGALDLSISPRKLESKLKKSVNSKLQTHRIANGVRRKGAGAISDNVVCYICGVVCPSSLARFIYAVKQSSDEPYFPFVLALSAPPGAMPVTKTGVTRVCSDCRKSLTRQWRVFESRGIDERDRTYKVGNCPVTSDLRAEDDGVTALNDVSSLQDSKETVCYACGQPELLCNTKLISTRASADAQMVFPFLGQLKCPIGARPVSADGRVSICRLCYGHLEEQWRQFEVRDVPLASRSYTMASHVKSRERLALLESGSDSKPNWINDNDLSGSAMRQSGTDLAVTVKDSRTSDSSENWEKMNCVGVNCSSENGVPLDGTGHEICSVTKPGINCFVCDAKCDGDLLNSDGRCYTLFSQPAYNANEMYPEDSKLKLSSPFFPFLEWHKHPAVAKSGSGKRCVDVCAVCYWHLIRQWNRYELSRVADEQNRWKRSYRYWIIPCDVCRAEVKRAEITIILCPEVEIANQLHQTKDGIALVCRACHRNNVTEARNGISQRGTLAAIRFPADRLPLSEPKVDVADGDTCTDAHLSAKSTAAVAAVEDEHRSSSSDVIDTDGPQSAAVMNGKPDACKQLQLGCRDTFKNEDTADTAFLIDAGCLNISTTPVSVPLDCGRRCNKQRPVSRSSQSRTDELMTPKNECLSSVPNFAPVSSDADADVISRSFASIGRQQLGSYIAGLGVHGLGADPSSSSLLMMHNYLLQQPPLPAAVNPAMAFQYPRLLGLLPSLGSLMNPPSFGAFLSRSQAECSTKHLKSDSEVECNEVTSNSSSKRPFPAEATAQPGELKNGPKSKSSGQSASSCSRPVFHRPFLDEDTSTPESENGVDIFKQTSCESSSEQYAHIPNHSVTSLKDGSASYVTNAFSGNGCANSRVTTSDDVDTPVCDGRLSAALGLISLGVVNEQSHSNSGSSAASLGSSSPAVKRGRFDPVSNASRSTDAAAYDTTAAALNEAQTTDTSLLARCLWDTNCIVGRKIAMRGLAASNTSFAWPGIEAVIEAYMRHIQEERIERVVLAEQHRNLKSINQQLTECCSQLDTKLEETTTLVSELGEQRVHLQTAIEKLKRCLEL